jgi:hypothetical protein
MGNISLEDLKARAKSLGLTVSDEELRAQLNQYQMCLTGETVIYGIDPRLFSEDFEQKFSPGHTREAAIARDRILQKGETVPAELQNRLTGWDQAHIAPGLNTDSLDKMLSRRR